MLIKKGFTLIPKDWGIRYTVYNKTYTITQQFIIGCIELLGSDASGLKK